MKMRMYVVKFCFLAVFILLILGVASNKGTEPVQRAIIIDGFIIAALLLLRFTKVWKSVHLVELTDVPAYSFVLYCFKDVIWYTLMW
jgi:hypothetical protein